MTSPMKRDGVPSPFGRNEEGDPCGPPPSPVSDLELTAYHEAGHAVFAVMQGWRVPHATIIPRWRGATWSRGHVKTNCGPDVDPSVYAKFILSGLAGEALLLGTRAFQVKKEFHEADEWLRAHMSQQDATAAMFDLWCGLMNDFSQKPVILAVMRVAEALLDRNSVKYETVLEIVDGAYRLAGPRLVDRAMEIPPDRPPPRPPKEDPTERRSGLSRRTLSIVPKPIRDRRNGEERRDNTPNTGG